MKLFACNLNCSFGNIAVVVDQDERLHYLYFNLSVKDEIEFFGLRDIEVSKNQQKCQRIMDQIKEYEKGERKKFELDLCFDTGTDFQQKVWNELRAIPYGRTISYGELAQRIGNPKAVRAVGGANGKNPISIVVPCHRVIGSNGSLIGYGGGMDQKQKLLELEGALPVSCSSQIFRNYNLSFNNE